MAKNNKLKRFLKEDSGSVSWTTVIIIFAIILAIALLVLIFVIIPNYVKDNLNPVIKMVEIFSGFY